MATGVAAASRAVAASRGAARPVAAVGLEANGPADYRAQRVVARRARLRAVGHRYLRRRRFSGGMCTCRRSRARACQQAHTSLSAYRPIEPQTDKRTPTTATRESPVAAASIAARPRVGCPLGQQAPPTGPCLPPTEGGVTRGTAPAYRPDVHIAHAAGVGRC